jgi:hypothetical protein
MHQLSIIRRESVDTVRVILDLCRLGYRHDLHGRCPELPGAVCHAVLSREWMRLVVGLKFHHGMAESGLYLGVILYLSIWYPRYMFQTRAAIFLAPKRWPGPSLAYWRTPSASWTGSAAIQAGVGYLFCEPRRSEICLQFREGLLTVAVGVAAYWIIVDFAQDAKFLTDEEKAWVDVNRNHAAESDLC